MKIYVVLLALAAVIYTSHGASLHKRRGGGRGGGSGSREGRPRGPPKECIKKGGPKMRLLFEYSQCEQLLEHASADCSAVSSELENFLDIMYSGDQTQIDTELERIIAEMEAFEEDAEEAFKDFKDFESESLAESENDVKRSKEHHMTVDELKALFDSFNADQQALIVKGCQYMKCGLDAQEARVAASGVADICPIETPSDADIEQMLDEEEREEYGEEAPSADKILEHFCKSSNLFSEVSTADFQSIIDEFKQCVEDHKPAGGPPMAKRRQQLKRVLISLGLRQRINRSETEDGDDSVSSEGPPPPPPAPVKRTLNSLRF